MKEPFAIKREVLNILPAASTDRTRLVLTGICFRNGNAIACNGHMLVAMKHDTPDRDMLIGAEELQTAFRNAPKFLNEITALPHDNGIRIDLDFGTGTIKSALNERYPSLERVIPYGDPKWETTFSIDLLHDLVKIAKRAGEERVTLRYLGAQDNEGAVLFALGSGKEYRGIICPCVLNRHASFLGERQQEPEEMSEAA